MRFENVTKYVEICIIFTKSKEIFLGETLLISKQQYDIIAISNKIDNCNINFQVLKYEDFILQLGNKKKFQG